MPKRRHPEWERIIQWSPPDLLNLLEEQSKLFGLEPWGWLEVPCLREATINAALVAAAKEFAERDGLSEKAAYEQAHDWLGIEDDTDNSQSPADAFLWKLRSWRRAVKQHSPPPEWLQQYFPATTDEAADDAL
jgi:hypothetical protein